MLRLNNLELAIGLLELRDEARRETNKQRHATEVDVEDLPVRSAAKGDFSRAAHRIPSRSRMVGDPKTRTRRTTRFGVRCGTRGSVNLVIVSRSIRTI